MSIGYIKWNRNGLCGAACAQMALHAHGVIGVTQDEQETLWGIIKELTDGNKSTQPCTAIVLEEFDNMIREPCANSPTVVCWATYPPALQAALLQRLGEGATVNTQLVERENAANGVIRDCLNRGAIPIVLINRGAHWVLVVGWDATATRPVKLFDPAVGAPSEVTVNKWNVKHMSRVRCGAFDDTYVIVEVEP